MHASSTFRGDDGWGIFFFFCFSILYSKRTRAASKWDEQLKGSNASSAEERKKAKIDIVCPVPDGKIWNPFSKAKPNENDAKTKLLLRIECGEMEYYSGLPIFCSLFCCVCWWHAKNITCASYVYRFVCTTALDPAWQHMCRHITVELD